MPDIISQVLSLLEGVCTRVFYQHPACMLHFPCGVLFESGNTVSARCDGQPHLHEIELTLEWWALSPGETHALCASADALLSALGLSRTHCTDLFDEDTRAHRRVTRYRALCDEAGTLTQA